MMSAPDYTEPELTVAILDFAKPREARQCLESVRRHVRVPHRVVYYHNGPDRDGYAYQFYRDGLVDLFMQSACNDGLGVGTRNVMAPIFTPYTIMMQNDQVVGRDLCQPEFDALTQMLGDFESSFETQVQVMSISLAGPTAGAFQYSERAHIVETAFYREMEHSIPLPAGGAGRYSHQTWREEAIQKHYSQRGFLHVTTWHPLVIDNGIWTIRDQPCGGRVWMRTDNKAVWWEIPPKQKYVFPDHTDSEWADAIAGQWVNGTTPHLYVARGEMFNCWGVQPEPF